MEKDLHFLDDVRPRWADEEKSSRGCWVILAHLAFSLGGRKEGSEDENVPNAVEAQNATNTDADHGDED